MKQAEGPYPICLSTKWGKRAASFGPKHALVAILGSSLASLCMEVWWVWGGGCRVREELAGPVASSVVGRAADPKCSTQFSQLFPHKQSQFLPANAFVQLLHQ
eukprot:1369316-Karenia_brevis.AAC.1